MAEFALAGLRVCDFTWAWAGPYCNKLLADMGAEIIKIESRKRLDIGRSLPPFLGEEPGPNRSGRYNKRNRNKLGITLDLTQEAGTRLARELVKISDVVIENYSPLVMKRFGFDYEAVRELRGDIVYLSLSGFGATGPYRDYVAYGPNQAALSGLGNLTGYREGGPVALGTALGDPTAGLHGAIALLAALHYRAKTGKGQHIDLSQHEMFVSLMGEEMMDYFMNGRVRERDGNRDRIMAPHDFYRCQGEDKWVSIAVATEDEWRGLCEAMGNPPWCREERFGDQLSRWRNQEELDRLIEAWTSNHTPGEVVEILQQAGVAAMPALNGEEITNDPHLRERGFLVEVDHAEVGRQTMPGVSMKLSHTPGAILRPAPLVGEHNQYVFGELLGLPPEEIESLMAEKVIY